MKKGTTAPERRKPGRLTALDRLEIASLSDNGMLDRATRLAARWLMAPVAVISLAEQGDLERISSTGLPDARLLPAQLCQHALKQAGEITEIEDLRREPRFGRLAAVKAPGGLRFYAAVRLHDANRIPIGVLSIADLAPRRLSNDERQALQDLSAMVEFGLMLRGLARTDPLTRTYNRRHLDLEIDREWRRALRHQIPVSVLMIDIDRFKDYNDTYGHQHGDQALKAVAGAINGCFRRGYDLLVRYGGEEFLVILPETAARAAAVLAEKVRAAVEALQIPHSAQRHGAVLTVSIGGATLVRTNPQMARWEQLVEQADQALYQAKRGGRNRVRMQTPAPAGAAQTAPLSARSM